MKIAIIGAPSSSNTTTSMLVTATLKSKNLKATFVPEFARVVAERISPNIMHEPLIMLGQMANETIAEEISDIVVCDSATFLCYIYALYNLKYSCLAADLTNVAVCGLAIDQIETIASRSIGEYDLIFLTKPQKYFIENDMRPQSEEDIYILYDMIRNFLEASGVRYYDLELMSPEDTAKTVILEIRKLIEIKKLEECHCKEFVYQYNRADNQDAIINATEASTNAIAAPPAAAVIILQKEDLK